jgi:hypothetical protein
MMPRYSHRGPYRNSKAERIRKLHAQGLDMTEVARRTGTSRAYVVQVTQPIKKETPKPVEVKPAEPVETKPSRSYTDRVRRSVERFSHNLVLLHTHYKNPDRVYSTWRYQYVSPVTSEKRSRYLGAHSMSYAEAWKETSRLNKIVAAGKDPFPVGVRATGWTSPKSQPVRVDDVQPIVVPRPAAVPVEPVAPVEPMVVIPSFLQLAPVNETKGDRQLIKPVPPEISGPVKERVKRVVKPKPLPEPEPTVWGAFKAKLRGWLA